MPQISQYQQYEQDRRREGRREARKRLLFYIILILGLFAFWVGVIYGAVHSV